MQYGGNTSCVEVRADNGAVLILDAGTGIRRLGGLIGDAPRIDILLSHLHVDHILGLGFFAPLFQAGREVHIWGPRSTTMDLRARLTRYLSAPLFPVHLRELPSSLTLHDVPLGAFEICGVEVEADLIVHQGPTLGYRLGCNGVSLAYMSDHEPALGALAIPAAPAWTSGLHLARKADLLIHDSQYTQDEYHSHIGWGHSSIDQAVDFAERAEVRQVMTFHHDPSHTDSDLDAIHAKLSGSRKLAAELLPGREGMSLEIRAGRTPQLINGGTGK